MGCTENLPKLIFVQVYPRRALRAEDWRAAQMLSLLSDPAKIMNAAQIDTMPCEYLSLDIMERWIICKG